MPGGTALKVRKKKKKSKTQPVGAGQAQEDQEDDLLAGEGMGGGPGADHEAAAGAPRPRAPACTSRPLVSLKRQLATVDEHDKTYTKNDNPDDPVQLQTQRHTLQYPTASDNPYPTLF